MQHLPLFADLKQRAVLVVGGGVVAERRIRLLLDAGARITVIAPEMCENVADLLAEGRIEHWPREFGEEPLEEYWLIVAATDDRAVNERVAAAAAAAKRFCNVVDDAELCSFIMPAIVDRAPVTIAIGTGGHSPVLARWVKGLIESWLPSRLGAVAGLAGRWRERVRQQLPDATERRHFWERVVAGPVAEHAYAGRDAEAEQALETELAAWGSTVPATRGEAYLVGAGPGSPDLITIRGRQLLATADVVLYDRLANPALLNYARRDAELVCVGKTPRRPSITQKQLNRLLVQLVGAGKRVCRLKGGDPFVFGRGGEEIEALVEAGLKFQVVPGVSAAEGCAAYAGIPLTLRGVSQAVVLTTGHTIDDSVLTLQGFRPGQTLALYMGVAQYGEISAQLIAGGHDPATPAAIVESGTTESQRVVRTTLRSLAAAQAALGIRPPALLLVGETTRFAERYSWFAPSRIERYEDAPAESRAQVGF
ncbi:MAG TPA: siroheme synthase CysG [Gammaproteobacteria bacterium]|jgi:uroporphyrin-III C-methyltransferase/precorrin-2 dehydrogenase/sirohydrochlorin ferrochelatase|nr:siroheme synthase CysG [Gammaproteobacteria bacterium]